MGRKGLSVRVRFEVFKRDRFTCQYCGKHPPDVLLEADHIVPVAAGGSNAIENLTTACRGCNQGKSDSLLEEGPAPSRQTLDDMRERVAQAKEYAELSVELESGVDDQVRRVTQAWGRAFGAIETTAADGSRRLKFVYLGSGFVLESEIRMLLRRGLSVDTIKDAIDICAAKFSSASSSARRYFFGICWRRIRGDDCTQPREAAGGLR